MAENFTSAELDRLWLESKVVGARKAALTWPESDARRDEEARNESMREYRRLTQEKAP